MVTRTLQTRSGLQVVVRICPHLEQSDPQGQPLAQGDLPTLSTLRCAAVIQRQQNCEVLGIMTPTLCCCWCCCAAAAAHWPCPLRDSKQADLRVISLKTDACCHCIMLHCLPRTHISSSQFGNSMPACRSYKRVAFHVCSEASECVEAYSHNSIDVHMPEATDRLEFTYVAGPSTKQSDLFQGEP